MGAISNTSPLCYLCLFDALHLLPALFGSIVVPPAVVEELSHASSPSKVRAWIAGMPIWLEVDGRELEASREGRLARLHRGERHAIQLALAGPSDIVLLDELAARNVARDAGLAVTGVLGILAEGAARGLIDLPESIARLRLTNFRVSPALLQQILRRYSSRSGGRSRPGSQLGVCDPGV